MFPPMKMDNEELVLRPMNCPHHMMVYKQEMHSYRQLPLRIAELGLMHRYEMSGAVSGLQRVRGMTLNDAHIFCRPDQIKDEFIRVVHLIDAVYKDFGLENYSFRLSYRDPEDKEKYFDDDAMWEKAQTMLKEAMDDLDVDYFEANGEAAFYGPKLDVQVRTALGKEETLSTVQLDFLMPERFDLTYVGEDGQHHRPVVIHRASFPRWNALLLSFWRSTREHCRLGLHLFKFNSFPFRLMPISIMRIKFGKSCKRLGLAFKLMSVTRRSVTKFARRKCKKNSLHARAWRQGS